ncbi:Nitrogen regulation protein NR(I) [Symmachiella dynata]|nr:response regulator [Symmachiella dynata]QDT47416.1 Nitrogen regulation protein NR(I) [Symmachiella dynata]
MKPFCDRADTLIANYNTQHTVLIIDDDPDITLCLEMVLANYDVNVIRDYGGHFGAWDAAQNTPDVIITDIAMPNGDGQLVLQSVKSEQQTADIPVLVLTGQRDESLASQLRQLGAACILYKPVHYQSLLNEILKHVPLRKLHGAMANSNRT